MGWADCGNDDLGRPIGYAHEATCDKDGCEAKIHRGLSYVCGGMHGGDGVGCGRYFCEDHRRMGGRVGAGDKILPQLCEACCRQIAQAAYVEARLESHTLTAAGEDEAAAAMEDTVEDWRSEMSSEEVEVADALVLEALLQAAMEEP